MQAGYGQKEITPPTGLDLSGYGYYYQRPAGKVLAPLLARAIMFRQAGKTALLIVCDLLGLTAGQVKTSKSLLAKELGLPEQSIMLASTHTHSGPATGNLTGSGLPDTAYLANLPGLLLEAGQAAATDLARVSSAAYLAAEVDAIGFNRAAPDGPFDKKVRAVVLHRDQAQPLLLVHHACHPVTLGPTTDVSPDYPGSTLDFLAKEGYAGIFLNGFCGDIDPVSNQLIWASGTKETVNEYGSRLAKALLSGLAGAGKINRLELDIFELASQLLLQEYDVGKIARTAAEYSNENNKNTVSAWALKMNQQLATAEPYQEKIHIPVLKLGQILLVGYPGEPFFRLGELLADGLPGYTILPVSNSNASLRYIAEAADIDQAGYGGLRSIFVYGVLPLQAGEGEKLAHNTAAMIRLKLGSPA